jgi:hypothetical protein
LISVYVESIIIILALARPVYLPVILIFCGDLGNSPFRSIVGDVLYLWGVSK